MSTEIDTDKVVEIIRQKVTEQEADEFFRFGPTGLSLFECCDDPAVYDDEQTTNNEIYAEAVLENMRGQIESRDAEAIDAALADAWNELEREAIHA